MSRRGGIITNFVLNGKLGRDTPLLGDLRGRAGSTRQVVFIETNDAGAFFRFNDVYPKIVGGEMWVAMDPHSADQAPQDGILNIRDFAVRGEAALDRVAGAPPGQPQTGVEFSRLRVEFTRSAGRLAIREGLVRGPVIGATVEGYIDYMREDVRLRGTFVPLYGLNNMFGQIPIVGLFLGGSNEGLLGVTYEVVGPPPCADPSRQSDLGRGARLVAQILRIPERKCPRRPLAAKLRRSRPLSDIYTGFHWPPAKRGASCRAKA